MATIEDVFRKAIDNLTACGQLLDVHILLDDKKPLYLSIKRLKEAITLLKDYQSMKYEQPQETQKIKNKRP